MILAQSLPNTRLDAYLLPSSPLRLLPAPPSEPPYDDELLASGPTLRLLPPWRPVADVGPDLLTELGRWEEPRREREDLDDDQEPPVIRTPTEELPPPRPFSHALVQRLLEVCAGVRPVSQLRSDTTPGLYEELEATLAARPRVQGLRPSRADVRSVHVQLRPDGVAEVCSTVVRGRRPQALALRLEGLGGRWVCSELVGI